jgi:hypothetical protein
MSAADSSAEVERVMATIWFVFFLVTRAKAFWFLVLLVAVELSALLREEISSPLFDRSAGPAAEGRCLCVGRWFVDTDIDMSWCLRLEFEMEFARTRATALANLPLSRRTRSLS